MPARGFESRPLISTIADSRPPRGRTVADGQPVLAGLTLAPGLVLPYYRQLLFCAWRGHGSRTAVTGMTSPLAASSIISEIRQQALLSWAHQCYSQRFPTSENAKSIPVLGTYAYHQ